MHRSFISKASKRQRVPGQIISAARAPDSSPTLRFLLGPLVLVASAGVQLILSAALLAGPVEAETESLTSWGKTFYHPERDVDIYVIGVVAALALCLVAALVWARTLRLRGTWTGNRTWLVALTARLGLAAAATAWFMRLWIGARDAVAAGGDLGPARIVVFVLLGCATLAAAAPVELLRRPAITQPVPNGMPEDAAGAPPPARLRFSAFDLLVPAAIFLLVYVPAWPQLAGRLFLTDAFFHWDYYAMGPALALNHGQALGTDSYAMYGVGWPALFSLLSNWLTLTYGRILQLSVLYGCLYFTGVYLLLRLLLRRPWMAAVGTGIALLQIFLGMASAVVWVIPSLTVLRWAFDVWCFVALVQYRRTRRPVWAVVAGACIGLAVVFGVDTGIYLAAAVAFFMVCTVWGDRTTALRPRLITSLVLSALVSLLAGLAVAAQGTIFTRDFWTGWIEPLQDYRGGFAQVPVVLAGGGTVVTFVILIMLYVAVAGSCLAKVLYRRARTLDLFTGMFAVYGLMSLLHFAGRSVDRSFYRLTLPITFIGVLIGSRIYSHYEVVWAERWRNRGRFVAPAVAVVLLALPLLISLFAAPSILLLDPLKAYPNLANRVLQGKEPLGLCLIHDPQDVCGLPASLGPTVNGFQAVAERLKALDLQGRSVAVIDESGSIFYLASGQEPFGRYPRMFLNMYSKRNERRVLDALTRERPDYVLTRAPLESTDPDYLSWFYFGVGPRADTPYPDTWAHLLDRVELNYTLEEQMRPFELWARK